MDRKGRTVLRRSMRLLLMAVCVSVQGDCQPTVEAPSAPVAVAPVPAAQPVAPAPATQLADGIWTVQGPAIPWHPPLWRLARSPDQSQGQLSGVVSHDRLTVPIENLVLMPDGSFSGSRRPPPSKITWRFSGDRVSLSFDSERCPPRHAGG